MEEVNTNAKKALITKLLKLVNKSMLLTRRPAGRPTVLTGGYMRLSVPESESPFLNPYICRMCEIQRNSS